MALGVGVGVRGVRRQLSGAAHHRHRGYGVILAGFQADGGLGYPRIHLHQVAGPVGNEVQFRGPRQRQGGQRYRGVLRRQLHVRLFRGTHAGRIAGVHQRPVKLPRLQARVCRLQPLPLRSRGDEDPPLRSRPIIPLLLQVHLVIHNPGRFRVGWRIPRHRQFPGRRGPQGCVGRRFRQRSPLQFSLQSIWQMVQFQLHRLSRRPVQAPVAPRVTPALRGSLNHAGFGEGELRFPSHQHQGVVIVGAATADHRPVAGGTRTRGGQHHHAQGGFVGQADLPGGG